MMACRKASSGLIAHTPCPAPAQDPAGQLVPREECRGHRPRLRPLTRRPDRLDEGAEGPRVLPPPLPGEVLGLVQGAEVRAVLTPPPRVRPQFDPRPPPAPAQVDA